MRPAQILLLTAVLATTAACSDPATVKDEAEDYPAADMPADPQQLAEQLTTDFSRLCLSGATSPQELFEIAKRSGWETFGAPEAMADMDRPWALRTMVRVSSTPTGPVCSVEHAAGDARVVVPILWRSIGAPIPTAVWNEYPMDICSTGSLEGRSVEACSFDFRPHGVASRLSTSLALPDKPQARQ